jgi:microcystin-dependent protein
LANINFVVKNDIDNTGTVALTSSIPPVGSVVAYALATPPAGWLLCDGTVHNISSYPTLGVGLGSTYGGNGTTTFAVPNLKGRVPVGRDSAQTEFDTLGEVGGAKTHTLTSTEMPSHTHTQNSHNHTQDAHGHNFLYAGTEYSGWQFATAAGGNINYSLGNGAGGVTTIAANTATNQAATATNQNTGGGEAHNNLQPYIVMNYIIRAV